MSNLYQHVKESVAMSSGRRGRLGGLCATALSLVGLFMPSASAGKPQSARRHAREALRSESASSFLPYQKLHSGARYYLALGFGAKPRAGDSPHLPALREALLKELQTLPGVVVSAGDAPPKAKALAQHQLKGFYIDGTIHLQSMAWAGGQKIVCELRMSVATWPHRAIKMMSTEGAALETGTTTAEQTLGQRDCLMATVGLTREDIQKYLQTVQ